MATNDLTSAIEQSHAALGAILKGDLGNPFGPYVRGRQKVEATLAGAASHYRDGEVTDVELSEVRLRQSRLRRGDGTRSK